jgi:hypothetical protein
MDPIYIGTDAEFAKRLALRLRREGMAFEARVARPDPANGERATGYLVEVEPGTWWQALECVQAVDDELREERHRALVAAQAQAVDQAARRGRMEAAFILALLAGGVIGAVAHSQWAEPAPCAWVPPVLLDTPPPPAPPPR